MLRALSIALLIAPLSLLGPAVHAQAPQGAPVAGPSLGASEARPVVVKGGFREIRWDELVPKGWDPLKDLKGLTGAGLAGLSDADPRSAELLKKMREVWDNAPGNPALDGQAVRIPGYVVPLEEGPDGPKEFLLVPYFGACIHSPPPPANQIIHVLPRSVPKGMRSMDAVWIHGTLVREKVDSYMGAAGYRMQAQTVEPYVPRAK